MKLTKYKLGDVAKVEISGVDKKTKDGEVPVKLCNFTDVYYNWSITKDMEDSFMVASANANEINRFSLKKGQVAFTKDSETRDDIGIPAYIADDFDNVILGYHCALITPDESKVLGAYINVFMHTSLIQKYFANNASGSGQRYSLSVETMERMPLFLPSLEEQKRIADLFTNLNRKIALNRQINTNLEALARQLYDYWFVQFDFPDANGTPYKSSGGKMTYNEKLKRHIPDGWEVKKVGDVCSFNKRTSNGQFSSPILYLDTANITDNQIDKLQLLDPSKDDIPSRARRCVMEGDIVYSTVRPNLKHFGLLYNPKNNLIVSTGFATITANWSTYRYYIYHFLKQEEIIEKLQTIAMSAVSSYPSINPSDIQDLDIIIPPNLFIDKYAKCVNTLYASFDNNCREISSLTKQRDELLPLLMNGQVTI